MKQGRRGRKNEFLVERERDGRIRFPKLGSVNLLRRDSNSSVACVKEVSLDEEMSSEKDIFSICGPTYLTSVDWACQHHCRSVAASLVQAVYVLERDRQLNRQFPGAFAPHWWEFFHFDLIRKLVDDADNSIFGAIFELNPNSQTGSISNAPRFVVAFRGTITEQDSISRDVTLNLHVIQNSLHTTSRFLIAMQAVKNVASAFPNSVIWLAGHSLGSALAMLVARNMVKTGKLLDTFLFNPPFCGAPIEGIRDERVKQGIRIARSLITAGLKHCVEATRGEAHLRVFFFNDGCLGTTPFHQP
ncbi:alpha/beta-Hydrolases superfamily protein [Rhynchospora pubera]|uniref:Alpha/beta-Hydrolases superfamily protein n=1 Tax=Rhynchospora pubera TaxID=906938 RepID=A0AAV8EMC2_9POAL|nr:alpha/beta-Hydrolases superfamily protein [Rhynchospora pubera]